MRAAEKKALLEYLEFHLVTMVEDVEPHVEQLVSQRLYQLAMGIIKDLEREIRPTNAVKVIPPKEHR
jgi:hypothetical protein